MIDQDKAQFVKVLAAALDSYGRRPPMPETIELWFQVMRQYSVEQIRIACQRFVLQSPLDRPTQGTINEIIRGKANGRRGGEKQR